MRRRKSYRRAPKRRTVRGINYSKNPLQLLNLVRHYSGSSGGRKSDNLPSHALVGADEDRYSYNDGRMTKYAESPAYNARDFGRTALGVASRNVKAVGKYVDSFLPIPLASTIGDAVGNSLTSYGQELSDRTYLSKNKATNALLSFLDGEDRPGNINKYTDFVGEIMANPKAITKSLKWASNFIKQPMPAKALGKLMDYRDHANHYLKNDAAWYYNALKDNVNEALGPGQPYKKLGLKPGTYNQYGRYRSWGDVIADLDDLDKPPVEAYLDRHFDLFKHKPISKTKLRAIELHDMAQDTHSLTRQVQRSRNRTNPTLRYRGYLPPLTQDNDELPGLDMYDNI